MNHKQIRRAEAAVSDWRHGKGLNITDAEAQQYEDLADVVVWAKEVFRMLITMRSDLLRATDLGQTARTWAYRILQQKEK